MSRWHTVSCAIIFALVGSPLCAMAQTIDVGRGPVSVHVPPSYDPEIPMPLVLLLHGRGSNGDDVEAGMQFAPLADEFGFLYLHPDGRLDAISFTFWSATDACCNGYGAPDTDSDYLIDLIEEMKSTYNVDDTRVHIAGRSNGGFMTHRMACDHSDTLASVASIAGATFLDATDCQPTQTIVVLEIHGTDDGSVGFEGGSFGAHPMFPGAIATTEQWAGKNGCQLVPEISAPILDLVDYVPGIDTTVTRYLLNCNPGGFSELWTIYGGTHSASFSSTFSRQVIEFFYANPKSAPGVPTLKPLGIALLLSLLGATAYWILRTSPSSV